MARTRKIPMRMCIGCRERKNKRELLRVVRTPEGEVVLDITGKKSGRGAYLCGNPACLEKVIASKGLERALEVKIDQSVVQELRKQLEELSLGKN